MIWRNHNGIGGKKILDSRYGRNFDRWWVYYDGVGNEMKKFNVKNGTVIKIVHAIGMKVIVLIVKEYKAMKRKMEEMQIDLSSKLCK